ncbi:MAG: tubulin-like doman-containing protein [Chthonomonadales bacterium]
MPAAKFKKTLVVGLGTSGKEICDAIAERLQWKYGDVRKIPWVRFLVLETDADTRRGALKGGDIVHLGIRADAFANLKQDRTPYDQQIDLSTWIDEQILAEMPGGSVTSGAGNIRMIGRLALLYPENYNNVRRCLRDRVDDLQNLKEGDDAVKEFKKVSGSGSNDIEFDRNLRVFVVGSLCGGTCSGTITDFGYIVKHVLGNADDKVTAIVTLPWDRLSSAESATADRFKRNAFVALQEINHFCFRRKDIPPPRIKAGGELLNTEENFPYDAFYLIMPEGPSKTALDKMHRAVADRVYLNIFNDAIDPYKRLVDAFKGRSTDESSFGDREHNAPYFCTFGLSTIEFPVEEVIKACTYKLMFQALIDWTSGRQDGDELEEDLKAAGLSYDQLVASVMTFKADGSAIEDELKAVRENLQKDAEKNPRAVKEKIEQVRSKFQRDYPRRASKSADRYAKEVYDRVEERIRSIVLGPHGLYRVRVLLTQLLDQLDELEKLPRPDPSPFAAVVDTIVNGLTVMPGLGWWRFVPWLVRRAKGPAGAGIRRLLNAVSSELDSRQADLVFRALEGGKARFLLRLRRRIEVLRDRADRLNARINELKNALDADIIRLASEIPSLNGKVLFKPAPNGTVEQKYLEELEKKGANEFLDWREVEEQEGRKIIRAWENLPEMLREGAAPSFLDIGSVPKSGEPIPAEAREKMEAAARAVFTELRNTSVVRELRNVGDPEPYFRDAVRVMEPLLHVNEADARAYGGSPLQSWLLALIPGNDADQNWVWDELSRAGIDKTRTQRQKSDDISQIVLLKEYHYFPLRACRSILDNSSDTTSALSNAKCSEFATFHTRKDVEWISFSKRENELHSRNEEWLALGYLLNIVELRAGHLRFSRPPRGPGDKDEVVLPAPIASAARSKVFADERGYLQNKVEAELKDRAAETSHAQVLDYLHNRLQSSDAAARGLNGLKEAGARAITNFCLRDQKSPWFGAYHEKYRPSEATIRAMRHEKGDLLPGGDGVYEESGIYCGEPGCTSMIGKDEQEAMLNGWRCFHYGHDNSRQRSA